MPRRVILQSRFNAVSSVVVMGGNEAQEWLDDFAGSFLGCKSEISNSAERRETRDKRWMILELDCLPSKPGLLWENI